MSDLSEIPRYSLRKRPTNDVGFPQKAKRGHSSLPSSRSPSSVVRLSSPGSCSTNVNASTLTIVDTPTLLQEQVDMNPTTRNSVPDHLTIRDRTFTGPLPPDRATDPSQNAANLSGDHSKYKLFVCEDCPIAQQDEEYGLHDLCYETHPCIWPFPPKAREAYANTQHWLKLGKPLEETRLPSGRLPRLLDEDGEPVTRDLVGVRKGADMNKAYEEVVKRRYRAVIGGYECYENRDVADDDHRFVERCAEHRVARETMLENMSWNFDW